MISSQLRMRRFENGTRDPAMISAILDQISIVHVGCFDEEYPYVVPLSFGYEIKDGKLLVYLHSAREGHKIDLWKKNPHVALTFSTFYNHPDRLYKGCMHDFRSVMALGTIAPVDRKTQSGLHGTAVQTILRQNQRGRTQFSVPHFMWMGIYVVTCDMENVVGKFENPIEDPSEVPFPDVYSIRENNEPYDCAYFYHKKQYPPKTNFWHTQTPDIPALEERMLQLPQGEAVDLTVHWTVRPEVRDMDLDLSALLLNQEGKVARRYDMVFYNQNSDQSGAVLHLGDDVLSEKRGQETLRLELDKASEHLSELVVNLSCFQSEGDMPGLEMLEAVWLTVSRVKDGAVTDRFLLGMSQLRRPAASLLSLKREGVGVFLHFQFGGQPEIPQYAGQNAGLSLWCVCDYRSHRRPAHDYPGKSDLLRVRDRGGQL